MIVIETVTPRPLRQASHIESTETVECENITS